MTDPSSIPITYRTVGEPLGRIALAGLTSPLPPELDDSVALQRLGVREVRRAEYGHEA